MTNIQASVVIPTHTRPEKIRECIRLLSHQTIRPEHIQVLVGVDGGEASPMLRDFWTGPRDNLIIDAAPHAGQAAVRNRLLPRVTGRTLVFLNDDMRPEPTLIEAHLNAQAELSAPDEPAIVIGDSPWVQRHGDRLFDRLIRESSMVFFYNRMYEAADAEERDWGFRHAWMLNLSVPTWAVRAVGGLTEFPSTYGYEDDELAYRLVERFGSPVRFCSKAVAWHDHRYEPLDYLTREYRLGYAALGFAQTAPACARALFGRDLTTPEERDYTEAFVLREEPAARAALAPFKSLTDMPADFAEGPFASELIDIAYSQHLPLKRWCWRSGFLDALIGAGEQAQTPRLRLAA